MNSCAIRSWHALTLHEDWGGMNQTTMPNEQGQKYFSKCCVCRANLQPSLPILWFGARIPNKYSSQSVRFDFSTGIPDIKELRILSLRCLQLTRWKGSLFSFSPFFDIGFSLALLCSIKRSNFRSKLENRLSISRFISTSIWKIIDETMKLSIRFRCAHTHEKCLFCYRTDFRITTCSNILRCLRCNCNLVRQRVPGVSRLGIYLAFSHKGIIAAREHE